MEKSPLKELNHHQSADVGISISGGETPTTPSPPKSNGCNIPDRLTVPKALKYPERYMSPTDHMISPVSKGLILARNRRVGLMLPPSLNHLKLQDVQSEEIACEQDQH